MTFFQLYRKTIKILLKTRKNKKKILEESLGISNYSINFLPALSKKTKVAKVISVMSQPFEDYILPIFYRSKEKNYNFSDIVTAALIFKYLALALT